MGTKGALGVSRAANKRGGLGDWIRVPTPGRCRNRAIPLLFVAWAGLFLAGRRTEGADVINMELKTPAVERLNHAISQRAQKINAWKGAGYIGEAADGLLAERDLKGVGLAEKKEIEDQVSSENQDRRALYREILKANALEDEAAGRVMARAAEARRRAALPGHWYQDPLDRSWRQVPSAGEPKAGSKAGG